MSTHDPHPKPSSAGKFLDQDTWDALKAAGYTDEQLYADQPFGPILFAYTRRQAIEDGVLVDLTQPGFRRLLRICGIQIHTAVTATAFAAVLGCPVDKEHADQVIGRTLVMLASFCKVAIRQRDVSAVQFKVPPEGASGQAIAMWASVGPGDQGEPVLTLMLEGED
jgi:hypothetical protein